MGPKLHDYWPFVPEWVPVHSYGFCIALGFILAALLARGRARRMGLDGEAMLDMAFWCLAIGIAGARLFYVIQFWDEQFAGKSLWRVLALHKGGLVLYGGLVGALPTFFIFTKRRRLPVLTTLDIMASVVMIGVAFGRIGCLSFGCCWGRPTDEWYGMVFPPKAPAYYRVEYDPSRPHLWRREQQRDHGKLVAPGTPLIPTQLISAFDAFVIFVILSLYLRWLRKNPGEVFALALFLYAVHRFWVESLRKDTSVPQGLSVAQWISVVFFAAGMGLMVLFRVRPVKETLPPPKPEAEDAPEDESPRPKDKRRKRSRKNRA